MRNAINGPVDSGPQRNGRGSDSKADHNETPVVLTVPSQNGTQHECQCQEHDCKVLINCPRPAVCGRVMTLHLCPDCYTNHNLDAPTTPTRASAPCPECGLKVRYIWNGVEAVFVQHGKCEMSRRPVECGQ